MKLEKNKKLNILEKISLWWRFEGRYYHRDFKNGVKNLWKWFPVIWKDRDWDDHYIFEVLKFKLNKQADYTGGRGNHVSAKRDAEIMRLVTKLIKLQQDEFYGMEYMDYHNTDYDFVPTDYKIDGKKCFEMKSTLVSEDFDSYFKKYPRQYKRVLSGDISRYKKPIEKLTKELIAMEIAHENQDRCNKLIFKLLEGNIQKWWN
jgi:hypothetical protein